MKEVRSEAHTLPLPMKYSFFGDRKNLIYTTMKLLRSWNSESRPLCTPHLDTSQISEFEKPTLS